MGMNAPPRTKLGYWLSGGLRKFLVKCPYCKGYNWQSNSRCHWCPHPTVAELIEIWGLPTELYHYEPPPPPGLEQLLRLRDTCLARFATPLKVPPDIRIEPGEHFSRGVQAHYHSDTNLICFEKEYLASQYLASQTEDTMVHELIHAWIHQHEYVQDDSHGTHFKIIAKVLGVS